jgi:hypothetical protein
VARRSVERARDGSFRLRLPVEERAVVRSVVGQLRALVVEDADVDLRRLYPTAYANDPAADAEFRAFVHDDLVARRLEAIDTVTATIDEEHLDEAQLGAWMGVVNDLRLVLGTRLDISEELDLTAVADDDPEVATFALYSYLSWLLEQMVEAINPR